MAEKEYIEREALCYQLAKQATIDGQPRAIKRAAKIVADFPAADVRPAEKCKWENLVRCGFGSVEATCSACGKTLIYKSWWHFCPNCGARVEKEQEDK